MPMRDVLGHEKIIADLTRLAGKGALSHSYMFYGPAMAGKRTTALALAHFLEKGVFEAPAANEVLQDATVMDAQTGDGTSADSIGIDVVREVKNFLWQKPNVSARRTLIIDEAELLTIEAQNALLKMTEEPPASSLLIVVTSDPDRIMPTILSRLQKIYFGTVPEPAIAEWLAAREAPATTAKAETAAIAKKSLGKPGLAWRLLNDEPFRADLERAEAFLKTAPAARRDVIKTLLEPDEFSLRKFLDAVIIVLAWEKPSKTRTVLWHNTLALYGNATNFSLNPRLQLENLFITT